MPATRPHVARMARSYKGPGSGVAPVTPGQCVHRVHTPVFAEPVGAGHARE
ncbi:hypothetical protein D9M71_139980 [compost metagenome]